MKVTHLGQRKPVRGIIKKSTAAVRGIIKKWAEAFRRWLGGVCGSNPDADQIQADE